jgi:DNA-directed RNA polymerase subunit beta'
VHVRSVLTCQARRGVCRKCYGWDLSTRSLVKVGTAVGIIAAQSIGEPGTQLTMRTFHSGGIAGGQSDITQGLPRVDELFEARSPKDPAIIAEIDGIASISKRESGGHVIQITAGSDICDEYPLPPQSTVLVRSFAHVQAGQVLALLPEGHAENREVRASRAGKVSFPGGLLTVRVATKMTRTYHIPPGRRLLVSDGQTVRAGDPLTEGALSLQEILCFKGRAALERYLLQEAQRVYRTTGAYIHDKHFEIIIRQMLRRVYVEQAGDTNLLPGSLVDRFVFTDRNARTIAQGGEPAIASAVVLGLTRAALATEGWLAAASFQQTTSVLTDATLEGRIDCLVGLKENVILGRRIPAGTGLLPPEPAPRRRSSPLRRLRIERHRS